MGRPICHLVRHRASAYAERRVVALATGINGRLFPIVDLADDASRRTGSIP
ncbi:hypothetical protein IPV08_15075 [Methylobacterium sp. SD274]|nr:hypothetical protein [Methylobacterium sp. SD274]